MANKELPVLPGNGQPQARYDCAKCPAYCCTYDWIVVRKPDIQRLAKRFGLSFEAAQKKFTKYIPEYKHYVLRHRADTIYKSACRFLHPTERRCTVYEHRPRICREHPEEDQCGYFDFLMWERTHQGDEDFIPLRR